MASNSCCSLRIVNVTDVYTLKYFPQLKTLLEEKKAEEEGITKTVSILTGDFLAPYLLSSVDKGAGMMKMLNQTPIDYVIFGNHEDDIDHASLCRRTKEYEGTWINTNMQDHVMFKDYHKPYEIITISSPDGSQTRKIGLIGVLSDSASLYRRGAFNGATIEDPYDTMRKYKKILEEEHGVDLVLPLCHLYVPQDLVTCKEFDFPVVLSGHDHHTVNEVHDDTLLLKAGADAKNAVILDLIWGDKNDKKPEIKAEILPVKPYTPDEKLQKVVDGCYSVLNYLKNTQLCSIPERFTPLSSDASRDRVCTMGKFVCTCMKHALNTDSIDDNNVEVCIIAGGDIRGSQDYPPDAIFSMESLKNEVQEQYEVGIVELPGHIIAKMIQETHFGPNPGYMQYDDGVVQDETGKVIQIDGKPVENDKMYATTLSIWDIQDGPSKTLKNYFIERPHLIPSKDACWPVYSTLISFFARNMWKVVRSLIDTDGDGKISKEEFKKVDTDGDGKISEEELKDFVNKLGGGKKIDYADSEFIHHIMTVAGDVNDDGFLDEQELGVGQSLAKLQI